MKLIVGLGNPGREYAQTRHNAGFMALDRLADRNGLHEPPRARFHAALLEGSVRGERCLLMKPTTYMNRSGIAVAEAVSFYKLTPQADLLVLVDDMALPCGTIRLRPGGGAGGHNGLADIRRALGTDAYPRCRIGIDPKPPHFHDQADYVLGRFTPEQAVAVEPALTRAAEAAEVFIREGLDAAMNRFNERLTGDDADTPKKRRTDRPEPGPTAGDAEHDNQNNAGDDAGLHPGWTP